MQVENVKEFIDTYIKEIVITIVILICLGSLSVVLFMKNDEEIVVEQVSTSQIETMMYSTVKERLFVDIKGAVINEGVYEVTSDMRVKDVISLAGGFREDADKNQINLAQVVYDEMVVFVPVIGAQNSIPIEETVVNLNTATKEKLMTVKGIGEKKAEAILTYRQKKPIKKLEDLLELKGFSEKFIESIRTLVRVS